MLYDAVKRNVINSMTQLHVLYFLKQFNYAVKRNSGYDEAKWVVVVCDGTQCSMIWDIHATNCNLAFDLGK